MPSALPRSPDHETAAQPTAGRSETVENGAVAEAGWFERNRHRRGLFATDIDAYDQGRPGYPQRCYELLQEVCGLAPGAEVVEIGPGTGQATGALLDLGARVTAVELSPELAQRLSSKFADRHLQVMVAPFEAAPLPGGSFDLVAAATSFHWVAPESAVQRCADLLREGGWLALWWTFFGDPDRPDPFNDSLQPLLQRIAPELLEVPSASGTADRRGTPYALNHATRTSEIAASGRFGPVRHERIRWTGRHTATELRRMFETFSPWLALPTEQRRAALDALEQLALDEFGGAVERPYVTAMYLAQRQA